MKKHHIWHAPANTLEQVSLVITKFSDGSSHVSFCNLDNVL